MFYHNDNTYASEMAYAMAKRKDIYPICDMLDGLCKSLPGNPTHELWSYLQRLMSRLRHSDHLHKALFWDHAMPARVGDVDMDNIASAMRYFWVAVECRDRALGVVLVLTSTSGPLYATVLPLLPRGMWVVVDQKELFSRGLSCSPGDLSQLWQAVAGRRLARHGSAGGAAGGSPSVAAAVAAGVAAVASVAVVVANSPPARYM